MYLRKETKEDNPYEYILYPRFDCANIIPRYIPLSYATCRL